VHKTSRFFLASLALLTAATLVGCGGDDGGNDAPRPTPPAESEEANRLFINALEAIQATTSLRYEITVYRDNDPVRTRLIEQEAPDRARRLEVDLVTGERDESVVVGTELGTRSPQGEWVTTQVEPGSAFSYPQAWLEQYFTYVGFAVLRDEQVDGRDATIITKWYEDDELRQRCQNPGGKSRTPVPTVDPSECDSFFAEDLIWIDKQTGLILRWDINKYDVDGDRRQLVERWESTPWTFNQDLTIEFA
jgi:hypothetical protein